MIAVYRIRQGGNSPVEIEWHHYPESAVFPGFIGEQIVDQTSGTDHLSVAAAAESEGG
jgi:hypothetical protein